MEDQVGCGRRQLELSYSNPVEDGVLYPIYEQLIRDLKIEVNGGWILDIGSGSGRWVRFFLERFKPAKLVGIDYTRASLSCCGSGAPMPRKARFNLR